MTNSIVELVIFDHTKNIGAIFLKIKMLIILSHLGVFVLLKLNDLFVNLNSFQSKEYNQDIQDKGRKQEADRFAQLLSVALAARLPESWISIQPYLLYTYIAQYLPTVFCSALFSKAAQGRIKKFKNNECLY